MLDKGAYLLARGAMAAIFLISGWGKLIAIGGFAAYAEAAGLPFPTLAVVAAAALEIGAGLALVIGWRVAAAAGSLALFTLVTAVIFHFNFADENEAIHFWKNVAIAGGLAHVALARMPEGSRGRVAALS